MEAVEIKGIILDVDYKLMGNSTAIRLTVKGATGHYDVMDYNFKPYFYFMPKAEMNDEEVAAMSVYDGTKAVAPIRVEKVTKELFGKKLDLFKVTLSNPQDVPTLSSFMGRFGSCYEYDIPFAKRYLIDKQIRQFETYAIKAEDAEGELHLVEMKSADSEAIELNTMCFDIETYNPMSISLPERDPILMISYAYSANGKEGSGVITYRDIDLPFVMQVKDEKELITEFAKLVDKLDIDIITGYNSANFDMKYLINRAKKLNIEFNLSRGFGTTKLERHGLVDKVKIGGRVHIDTYQIIKFISVVGAAESLLKLNSYTLKNVYEAVTNDKKVMVEKKEIYNMWDGTEESRKELARYNLNDSLALKKIYDTFIPIMIELAKITGNAIGDVAVSTTGQLVEYLLMRYAHESNELIPNKPTDAEIRQRVANPIEGAYVKTPDPGIYDNIVVFDFRSLYPSIIISHNIDPSSICADCKDYYESPIGVKFDKNRKSIMPTILEMLVNERKEVKKQYKLHPDDIFLGARSMALKITANSFYGYLGYARSRWYSRECAASVTAYGRQYIKETIKNAEDAGFRVLYGDTDSIFFTMGSKTEEDVKKTLNDINSKLPKGMELELEDFYVRGIFVGKKGSSGGAKKKYALRSVSGKLKIKGFELVRRDWSKIARDTQEKVLSAILKDGSVDKAVAIVQEVIKKLRDGKVPISELAISTRLRKGIDNYDTKSPELGAALKAVESGKKKKEELEQSVISYVITKNGSSISDKAVLEEFARDYDADYYIEKQIIPATLRILGELGVDMNALRGTGKQSKL